MAQKGAVVRVEVGKEGQERVRVIKAERSAVQDRRGFLVDLNGVSGVGCFG